MPRLQLECTRVEGFLAHSWTTTYLRKRYLDKSVAASDELLITSSAVAVVQKRCIKLDHGEGCSPTQSTRPFPNTSARPGGDGDGICEGNVRGSTERTCLHRSRHGPPRRGVVHSWPQPGQPWLAQEEGTPAGEEQAAQRERAAGIRSHSRSRGI
eukprot:scaffold910_cov396-Prasinococcus_capsulatus_cf.AAC.7